LVAEFTGRDTLDRFMDRLRHLVHKVRNDGETMEYLRDVRSFILETRTAESMHSEEFKGRIHQLIEKGRRLVENYKYSQEVTDFLDTADEFLDNMKNDDIVRQLRERAGILVEDLTYEDEHGHRQVDTTVLSSIRRVIVPVLAEALKYIPIPRIEDVNSKREYVVDNIVLCGYDIIPDNVFIHLESDAWVSVRELETESSRTRLVVELRNIRTELKDVHFCYKKKGFPKLEEAGRVTARIGGKGARLSITFRVDQRPGDPAPHFTDGKVDFEIDKLDLDFDRSTLTHDILVPMISTLFKGAIILAIERSVSQNLTATVNDIGSRLSESLLGAGQPRFTKQLESMRKEIKQGEFSRKYQQRQEILK